MIYRIDQPLERGDIVHHRTTGETGKVLCSPWWNDSLVVPVRRVLILWEDPDGAIEIPSDVACIGRVERDGVVIWDETWPPLIEQIDRLMFESFLC